MPAAIARAQARLNLAVIRGLLLDLLATGDRKVAVVTPPTLVGVVRHCEHTAAVAL